MHLDFCRGSLFIFFMVFNYNLPGPNLAILAPYIFVYVCNSSISVKLLICVGCTRMTFGHVRCLVLRCTLPSTGPIYYYRVLWCTSQQAEPQCEASDQTSDTIPSEGSHFESQYVCTINESNPEKN